MWQSLKELDKAVFLFVNHLPHNLLTDSFFLFFSSIGFYGFIWFAILIILFLIDGLDNRKEILALLLAVIVEVVIVELTLKNIFIRLTSLPVILLNLIKSRLVREVRIFYKTNI